MRPIRELIVATGALQEDAHVVGSDGRHVLGFYKPERILAAKHSVLEAIGLHLVLPFYESEVGVVIGQSTEMELLESAALGISRLTCKRPLVVPLLRTNEGRFVCDESIAGSHVLVVSAATNTGRTSQGIVDAVHGIKALVVGATTVCYVGEERFPPLGATRSIALLRNQNALFMAPQNCTVCRNPNKPIVIELSDLSGDHLDHADPKGGFITTAGRRLSKADLLKELARENLPEQVLASA